jgi:hypothetical protein
VRASTQLRLSSVAIALLALAGSAHVALAQKVELAIGPAPYYVDSPIVVQVTVSDFEESPQPEVRVRPPAGTKLASLGISPSVSSVMQMINGRFESSKTVKFVYRYELTASKPGEYALGPFEARQGSTARKTGQARLNVVAIPNAETQKLELVLPDRPVRVGERVPIELQWWSQSESAGNLFNQRAQMPLLSDIDNVRITDVTVEDPQGSIIIETRAGPKEYPTKAEQRRIGGTLWFVRSVPLILTPVTGGTIAVAPSSLTVDEALRWRRDFFGQRTATQSRRLRTTDIARTLNVLPLPQEGRPESFAGAVGSAFSISVDADRTVVATGDPVKLTITLNGDGTIETASLPPLDRAGLDASQFSVPSSAVAGIVDGRTKRFEVSVRVRDDRVSEIPPIEYSWFDPEAQEYRRTTSQPIALSVREAQVVGAESVVRGTPSSPSENAAETDSATDSDPQQSAITYTLFGADLALEHDTDQLLADDRPGWFSKFLNLLIYAVALVLLAAAAWQTNNNRRDPEQEKHKATLTALVGRVDNANEPMETAKALQALAAQVTLSDQDRTKLGSLLAELETIAYAPENEGKTAAPGQIAEARKFAANLVRSEASS